MVGASFQSKVEQWASRAVGPQEMLLHLRNIPTHLDKPTMLRLINDSGFAGGYDFFYLPCNFQTGDNLGYAFINFVTKEMGNRFIVEMGGLRMSPGVPLVVKKSSHQGLQEYLHRWTRTQCRRVKNRAFLPYVRCLTELGEPNLARGTMHGPPAPDASQIPAPIRLLDGQGSTVVRPLLADGTRGGPTPNSGIAAVQTSALPYVAGHARRSRILEQNGLANTMVKSDPVATAQWNTLPSGNSAWEATTATGAAYAAAASVSASMPSSGGWSCDAPRAAGAVVFGPSSTVEWRILV